jgi:ABC-2 type transport system ATP-binding protein
MSGSKTNEVDMTPLIEAGDLRHAYGKIVAVEALSVEVDAGEIYGLVGPDGAGKTTTIRMLCGALRPDRGWIRLGGIDLLRRPESARALIGYLPQRFSLYEDLTTIENLRFFAEVRGMTGSEWRPRSDSILEFVGLKEFKDRRAGHLSGGMRQKLGLAAALVHGPKVLLLDEPTTGVDPVTRREFWKLIVSLVAKEGVAVLISTPYMDEATRCSRVGYLRRGRLVLEGQPTELTRRLDGRVLELRGVPLSALRALAKADPDVETAQVFGDRLHLRVAPGKAEEVIERLQHRPVSPAAKIDHLAIVRPSLEDVFIHLTETMA